jgi:hypothetical protein
MAMECDAVKSGRVSPTLIAMYHNTPEVRVRFSALPDFLREAVVLERGPLSLVSKTEELLDRKVAAPV